MASSTADTAHARDDARIAPAPVRPLDDAAHERRDAGGEQDGAEPVGPRPRPARAPRAGRARRCRARRCRRGRSHEEDPAPARLDEEPADRGTRRRPRRRSPPPSRRRRRRGAAAGTRQQQRERRREHERRVDGLRDVRREERLDRPGGGARRAGGREQREPSRKTRLRRTRRPSGPPGPGRAANTIVYVLRIQLRRPRPVPANSCCRAGKAMLTMNRSRLAMKAPRHTTATDKRVRCVIGRTLAHNVA